MPHLLTPPRRVPRATARTGRRAVVAPMLAAAAALAVAAVVGRPLRAADDEPLGGKIVFREPKKLPVKNDDGSAERAIGNFRVAQGLKVKLWAAEPMLSNPNALAVDEKGVVYVTEANRFKGGVIDNRDTPTWLEEDNAAKTVADRVAMVKRHAAEKQGRAALDSTDAERIMRIEDTTGSGVANKATVFSEGYNRVEDGLASGVLAYKGNVYATIIPNLYKLTDTAGAGKADKREVLSTGYGVRYAFLGHDLHGLVVGPDGRLYFSVGDRAANAEAVDGSTVTATETGSVFRCDLDGKNLELFATGLRNPQELRFDSHGNLFTGDNNPDKGDPARWVYVVEGGDSGWRVGYQHAKQPRDGGPWTSEQIFQVAEHNNANYIVPPVSHVGAGPSGLAYNTGVGLPERFNDAFFLCDFRGAANTSGIWAVRNKPKGATFEVTGVDGKPIDRNTKITEQSIFSGTGVVDCEQGPDGSLYFADWTQGWDRPFRGRVYRIVDETQADGPLVAETKKLIGEGMTKRSPDELVKLLAHADLRVRREAQFALAAKGAASVATLTGVAAKSGPVVPRLHAVWGLGQIGRDAPADTVKAVLPLLADADVEVRCQAAQVVGDLKDESAFAPLMKLASDPELRVRHFAAMALGKLKKVEAIPALVTMLKENADKDPVVRYGAVWAMAKINDDAAVAALAKDPSPSVRLGAALALRKMESPEVAKFLADDDRVVVLEAARAIHDLPIEPALPELAKLASAKISEKKGFNEKATGTGPGPQGGVADWILWRAANANLRLGTPEAAKALASLAERTDVAVEIRTEALQDLAAWAKPGNLDRITNLYRPLPDRNPAAAREAAKAVVEELAKDKSEPVKVAAAKLMQKYGLGSPETLKAAAEGGTNPPEVRLAALETLLEQKHASAGQLLSTLAKDKNDVVRRSAIRKLGTQADGEAALAAVLGGDAPVGDKQAAVDGLAASADPKADAVLADWLGKVVAKQAPAEMQLELLEAAAKRKDPKVAALLKQAEAARDTKDALGDYRETLAGGDPASGRKTFAENAAVSCIRCHMVNNEGGIVGPALDGIALKHPPEYLLESIVAPNAQIAPGFESAVVQTKDKKYKTGVVKKDDAKEIVLLNADNELITIAKADVIGRERGPSAMPEGLHKVLPKRELRDLVAWLTSLKEPAKGGPSLDHGAAAEKPEGKK
jgi:quinoprotein glucose dehydrogenase